MNVRKLDTLPVTLLWESGREGLRFVRRALLGACALSRDPYVDSCAPAVRDGARLSRVRHLYILRAYRRRGIGGGLIEALLEEALAAYDALTLRTETASAAAFYEAFGFRRVAWPNATHLLPLSHGA